MLRCRLCDCHDKPPMLYAFQANKPSSELFDLSGLPVHDEDFETRIVVEMCMICRDHKFMIGMLKFRQPLCDTMSMMIVDEGDSADDSGIGTRCSLRDQAIADQIAESLGSVRIAEPSDEIIKAFEQIRIQRNADSAKNTHGHSLEEDCRSTGYGKIAR
jgi:hypothetical protein